MNHYDMLRKVSRTFAVSIEQLPRILRETITVAYLLFRVSDCIEDSPVLTAERKAHLLRVWSKVLMGQCDAGRLIAAIADLDSEHRMNRSGPNELGRRTCLVSPIRPSGRQKGSTLTDTECFSGGLSTI